MDKKNRFKLAAMAGTCVVCVMVPASLVFSDYSDKLLVDSYYGDILDAVSRQDALIDSYDDILIQNGNNEETIVRYEDDILFSGSDSVSHSGNDDILFSSYDDIDRSSYSEIMNNSREEDNDDVVYSSVYDPSSLDEDIFITKTVLPTPTPTSKPSESRTVKGAMKPSDDPAPTDDVNVDPDTETNTSAIDAVIKAVNAKRSAAGVAPVVADSTLNYVASQRVKETTKKFSHTRPNGKDSASILSDYSVHVGKSGENIACCISSPEGVVAAWSNSPSHNRCMLNSVYTHAGVGCIVSDGVTYWVLILTD